MKITAIETHAIGVTWKNWLFVRVHTDEGIYGVGEGTLNGLTLTIDAAIKELSQLAIGQDPRNVNALARRMYDSVSNDGGHIHRIAIGAVEVACWDILGKSLGVPVYQLLGGKMRESVLGYANGWYRNELTPAAFVKAIRKVKALGFKAAKLDPFGTAVGFIEDADLKRAYDILAAIREETGPEFKILIDVHRRFTQAEALRAARKLEPIGLYWWEEPTTGNRHEAVHRVAEHCPINVATGEAYDKLGQFFTLAERGSVNIFQPEPMCLGGISPTMAVASLADAHGSYIAPHQSGGPIATAVCLQIAAACPNFLIQEHFDAFNDPWTHDLVSWRPTVDPANGHLSLPQGPGLGIDFNSEVAKAHPYDPKAYLNIFEEGWEQRIGTAGKGEGKSAR